MKYIYMNERIRQKRPRKPVIVCQAPEGIVESNSFALCVNGIVIGHILYDRDGLPECETHDVKAWVQLFDHVEVVPFRDLHPVRDSSGVEQRTHNPLVAGSSPAPATKPASEKKPGKPVAFL